MNDFVLIVYYNVTGCIKPQVASTLLEFSLLKCPPKFHLHHVPFQNLQSVDVFGCINIIQ